MLSTVPLKSLASGPTVLVPFAAEGRGSEGRHERIFRFLMELVTQL